MIILSLCQTCLQQYEILVEASDLPLIKEISDEHGYTCPCPRLCGGVINLIGNEVADAFRSKQLKLPVFLSGKDLYKAVKGMGLPDEVHMDKIVIDSMLKANRVNKMDIEEYNGKFYIHELSIDNGVTIHLAAGIKGAQILKITKERT